MSKLSNLKAFILGLDGRPTHKSRGLKCWNEDCCPPETDYQSGYEDGYNDGWFDAWEEVEETAQIERELDERDAVYSEAKEPRE